MSPSINSVESHKAPEVAEGADLDAFLDSVLEEGLRVVGAAQGSLMLLNAREGILEIIKRRGPPYDLKRKHHRFKLGDGIAGKVAQQCKSILKDDVHQDPDFEPALGELNFRSLLAVPIVREDRAIGVISVDSPEVNQFKQSHVDKLSHLAQNVSDTIEQLAVDTFISHTKRLKQLEGLYQVSQELSKTIFESPEELSKLLERIAKGALRVLEADLVTLYQYYEKDNSFETPPTLSGQYFYPEYMVGPVKPEDVPYRIIRMGSIYYSEEAWSDQRVLRAGEILPAGGGLPERRSFTDRENMKSGAGIPLKAGQEIVGIMFVGYRISHPFPNEEKQVIETFATSAALAIQGARRVEQAMRLREQAALQQTSRMVAHRLRNVLPVISGRIYRTLTNDLVKEKGIEWCRVALQETRRAQKIVRDFESFSQAEVFEQPNVLTGAELVQTLEEIVVQNLTQADAQVSVQMGPQQPLVKVNLDRLSDDFAAFVRDSERHKPTGLRITISCEMASKSDIQRTGLQGGSVYLKLIYTDNGPGIPPEFKRRIFEPFHTTTGGSGLGLAIAKHNAGVHGGTIIECGQPGHGVRFELYLSTE